LSGAHKKLDKRASLLLENVSLKLVEKKYNSKVKGFETMPRKL
jgi:hypothetical protein